jgi:hypothetical protein
MWNPFITEPNQYPMMVRCIPKAPSIPEPPPVEKTDQAAQEAAAKAREVARKRRGRASTILTSPQGDLGMTQDKGKTLLGM